LELVLILSVQEGIRAFYFRLIRGKLLQERSYGQPTWFNRLLHLGPMYGLIFSAPAIATMAWYSGLAVSSHMRHVSALKSDEKLTTELFQLHLHDRLRADYRRLTMPEPQSSSELPTYGLFLSNDKLSQLDSTLPPEEGKTNYVTGLMQHKNKLYEIEARYRGTKPWHWNNPQKSWKVRGKGNRVMFDGLPTFNFVNTPDPMPFNEQMVLDTARDIGLLTPAYYPFRLLLNNAFLGIYFFEAQADEGLLRRERRMPGSIYSGAGAPIDPKTKVSSLWAAASNWKKVGAIGDKAMTDFRELEALLKVVNSGTAREFADFAQVAIDVDKFAAFDAIDVVFGNNQHDYHQNHKLYFDPYKNRFEPIATEFRDMEHERLFNRTEYPLLLRLKELPEFLTLRNRKVYELLQNTCNENALKERVYHWLERLKPDQERDPYWDAYEQLPVMGTYYRQLVRPMNLERQSEAAESRLKELRERVTFLRTEIEHQDVRAELYETTNPVKLATKPTRHPVAKSVNPAVRMAVLDITVQGNAGFRWTEVLPETDRNCTPLEWQIYAERDLDQTFIDGKDLRLVAVEAPARLGKPDITLYPGIVLEEIPLNPFRGKVQSVPEERSYRFYVRAQGCMPSRWRLEGTNAATNINTTLTVEAKSEKAPNRPNQCEVVSGFLAPGRRSPHPFCYPFVSEDTVRIGPGTVEIAETRVFTANQTVIIEPGTTLRMAEGASIVSYGRLLAEGQKAAPIRFEPVAQSWGGLALQGPRTAGSRLSYVDIKQGSRPVREFFDFPGMVSIHDTKDIRVDHCHFANNHGSDDALHVAYVQDIAIAGCRFDQTFSDAIDLEYSSAKVERTTMVNVGDDGLDLMGSRVEVQDGTILQCQGNGISAGERSDVLLRRELIAKATRAVLLKNGSSVSVSDVAVYQAGTVIRQEPESEWYPGTSVLSVESMNAIDSKLLFDGIKKPKSGVIRLQLGLDDLPQLRQSLLGEGEWNELEAYLKNLQTGSTL
jgi:muconolactone delta-isomerase